MKLLERTIKDFDTLILERLPENAWRLKLFWLNASAKLLGGEKTSYRRLSGRSKFVVADSLGARRISNSFGQSRFWRLGFRARGVTLQKSYGFSHEELPFGGVVVDVGANMGDFLIPWNARADVTYIAIEPGPDEHDALVQNLQDSKGSVTVLQIAAGAESKVDHLYLSSEGGDNSLHEPAQWTTVIEVEQRRLDDIAALRELETIHVLKIEAEGSEPEVLAGARQVLSKTLTVLVDCGPERGPEEHATLAPVVNMMLNSGFRCTDNGPGNSLRIRFDRQGKA